MRDHASMNPANTPIEDGGASVRLDVWLWAARFYKTRALAKQALEGGKVEVNGAVGKPAKAVRRGDLLRVTRGEDRHEIEILELSEARGPARVAQLLYRETEAGRAAREAAAEQRRLIGASQAKPPGKPDKRARRLIRALGDIDAF